MKTFTSILLFLIVIIGISNAQYIKLHDFEIITDGAYPYNSFVSDGTYLYGTAHMGGTHNNGTLFKIKPDGSNYTILLNFNDTITGNCPYGTLIYDGTFLYGTTMWGGTNNKGTIFKIKPDGSGYVKLYDFDDINGQYPQGTLAYDGTFLYGTTSMGGENNDGLIYRIKPDGNSFSILMSFERYTSGFNPNSSLFFDGIYLYGMTKTGGITATSSESGDGTIFKIKTDGTGYVKLLDFIDTNGGYPYRSLISDGTFLYGMTAHGGLYYNGTVFKIKTDGSNFITLFNFNVNTNGGAPQGNLILIDDFVYGMTSGDLTSYYGTIFKIKTDGSNYTKLWDFINTSDGVQPLGTLFSDSTFLYGMTYNGGANDNGVIFKFDISITEGIKGNNNNILSLYPNPSTGNVQLTMNNEQLKNARIEITDINGRIVKQITNNKDQITIDLSGEAKGVYFVKLISESGVSTQKLVLE